MWYNNISEKYQIGFQEEATPSMIGIRDLHDNIMYYIIIIVTVVTYITIKLIIYKRSTLININNKYITHSTIVEIIWTIIPALILISIAIPSFKLLYSLEELLKPLITLKITGNQWYWNYTISDYENIDIKFDSYLVPESDLIYGSFRLLEVDNRIFLPILTPIRLLITSDDVIHSFALPSLGVKLDAIPGRINQLPIYILKEGVYYGQCSELCGLQHAYMPIVLEAVNITKYYSWLFSFTSIPFNHFINFLSSF